MRKRLIMLLWLMSLLALGAACGGEAPEARLPNEGASIEIAEPANGAVFPPERAVEVFVKVENFELGGQDNNHWHIYVDDEAWGMIFSGETTHALFGLEPGQHKISVYLANGEHQEYEQGDSVNITIEE